MARAVDLWNISDQQHPVLSCLSLFHPKNNNQFRNQNQEKKGNTGEMGKR